MERREKIYTQFENFGREFYNINHFDNLGVLALYGSQNYLLDTENSDIDIKGFITPTINDIALNNSCTTNAGLYVLNDFNGTVSLQDIRLFTQLLKKSNFNSLEILYSPYFMYNNERRFSPLKIAFRELKSHREDFVTANPKSFFNSIFGCISMNLKRMNNTNVTDNKKFGKAVATIMRLTNFLLSYYENRSYDASLQSFKVFDRDLILFVKKGLMERDKCIKMAELCEKEVREKEDIFNIKKNEKAEKIADEIMREMIIELI